MNGFCFCCCGAAGGLSSCWLVRSEALELFWLTFPAKGLLDCWKEFVGGFTNGLVLIDAAARNGLSCSEGLAADSFSGWATKWLNGDSFAVCCSDCSDFLATSDELLLKTVPCFSTGFDSSAGFSISIFGSGLLGSGLNRPP